jgi:hypothetical protein
LGNLNEGIVSGQGKLTNFLSSTKDNFKKNSQEKFQGFLGKVGNMVGKTPEAAPPAGAPPAAPPAGAPPLEGGGRRKKRRATKCRGTKRGGGTKRKRRGSHKRRNTRR